MKQGEQQGFVVWFTGLSGSGKSTLADGLFAVLKSRGLAVERLDGDAVRALFPETGFSRDDRDAHIRRVGHMASMLERNGIVVVASFISPYARSRRFVREQCRDYFEVYLKTPLEICEQRDPKGLYRRARAGELTNFTGIDDVYETPAAAELEIDTGTVSVPNALRQITDELKERGYLRG